MSEPVEIQQTGRGMFVPLNLLEVEDGFNVRQDTAPDQEFLSSIEAHGVLRPLHIRNNPQKPGCYFIVDGERRFRAAIELGLEGVPVIPEGDMDDASALVMSLVANEGAKPLTAKEEAEAFLRLRGSGVTVEEIARVMGRSERKVEETLRALESGDEELVKGVITEDPEEKIAPRAAARAATLPEKARKEVTSQLKGKTAQEGVKIVRDAEKASGILRRGRKADDYPWAKNAKSLAELLEKAAKKLIRDGAPGAQRAKHHLEVISVLKGKTEPGELYEDIMDPAKKEEAPRKVKAKKAVIKKPPTGKKRGRPRKIKEEVLEDVAEDEDEDEEEAA